MSSGGGSSSKVVPSKKARSPSIAMEDKKEKDEEARLKRRQVSPFPVATPSGGGEEVTIVVDAPEMEPFFQREPITADQLMSLLGAAGLCA